MGLPEGFTAFSITREVNSTKPKQAITIIPIFGDDQKSPAVAVVRPQWAWR
jgi:hypothetical protein